MTLQAGIHRNIDPKVYYADPCDQPSFTQSLAKVMVERSPLHVAYEHPRLMADEAEPEEYNKVKAIGSAAHAMMIGRGKTLDIIKANDFKGGEAKKLRDAAYAAGNTPVLEKHYETAVEVVAAGRAQLDAHQDAADAFTNGSGEVALIWQEHDGIWCRALVDWLSADLRTVDDYKTTGMSVAPHIIGIRAEAAGWHIQHAFIERGLDILDPKGQGRRRFRNIAQEQDGRPYALTVMEMNEHWMTMGRKKVAWALAKWRVSVGLNRWPGYGNRSVIPEYPGFKEKQWLERELSGELESMNDTSLLQAG